MFRMMNLAYISQSSDFDSFLGSFLNIFIELSFEINLQLYCPK